MISKQQWEFLQKAIQDSQPSALKQAMSMLQSAPNLAARMLVFFAAKRELTEMKNELNRLQACVQSMELILDQQGPTACARSNATHTFVNWTVSFAESYYSLATAFNAEAKMIPRVLAYLNGQHKKFGFMVGDLIASLPPQESLIEKSLRQVMEQSTRNVPGFLKP